MGTSTFLLDLNQCGLEVLATLEPAPWMDWFDWVLACHGLDLPPIPTEQPELPNVAQSLEAGILTPPPSHLADWPPSLEDWRPDDIAESGNGELLVEPPLSSEARVEAGGSPVGGGGESEWTSDNVNVQTRPAEAKVDDKHTEPRVCRSCATNPDHSTDAVKKFNEEETKSWNQAMRPIRVSAPPKRREQRIGLYGVDVPTGPIEAKVVKGGSWQRETRCKNPIHRGHQLDKYLRGMRKCRTRSTKRKAGGERNKGLKRTRRSAMISKTNGGRREKSARECRLTSGLP